MHYAIGDIHGCFDELMALINEIKLHDSDATFILLGDLIDRGPKSIQVLEWAMSHISENGPYQMVLGNHDEMFLDWFKGIRLRDDGSLISFGHLVYGFDRILYDDKKYEWTYLKKIADFYTRLPLVKTLELPNRTFILAHAWATREIMENVWNGVSKEASLRRTFLWDRRGSDGVSTFHDTKPFTPQYCLVYGHTPIISEVLPPGATSGEIFKHDDCVGIDCGICFRKYGEGRLAAFCLEEEKAYYYPKSK